MIGAKEVERFRQLSVSPFVLFEVLSNIRYLRFKSLLTVILIGNEDDILYTNNVKLHLDLHFTISIRKYAWYHKILFFHNSPSEHYPKIVISRIIIPTRHSDCDMTRTSNMCQRLQNRPTGVDSFSESECGHRTRT